MDIDISLSVLFVDFFNKKKSEGVTHIPCTAVAKKIMLGLYEKFVIEGVLNPIEELSLAEKQNLISECKMMKDIFYTNEKLITNCKILHLINLINVQ